MLEAMLVLIAAVASGEASGPLPSMPHNSPVVDASAPAGDAFHELNLDGLSNAAGFSVRAVRKDSTPYRLDVDGPRVTARSSAGPTLSGAGLVGLELEVTDRHAERFVLRVAGVGEATYAAGAREPVATYVLTYTTDAQREPRPLCTTEANEALLYTGDRYDAGRKEVVATGASTRRWMQIGCAGTALAKLFLNRHTEASQVVSTTTSERQAMLKMLTADVCGDGTAFTVHGQPLVWSDRNGVTSFQRTPASLEAIWSDHGALCLDTPRRPELASAIAARCGVRLPRCAALTAAVRSAGYVTSANVR